MWVRADIAQPSVDDQMALYGDASCADVAAHLKNLGVSRGTMKRGADGPLNLATGTTPENLPNVDKVLDLTSVGDSFNAGFFGRGYMPPGRH